MKGYIFAGNVGKKSGMYKMTTETYFDEYPIFPMEKLKEKIIGWDHNQLRNIEFKDRLARSPTFGRAFIDKYDMTRTLYSLIFKKVKGKIEDHMVIEFTGPQGIGKSRIAQVIAKKIWHRIGMNNIVFRFEDALQRAKGIKKKQYLIVDEQVVGFGVGSDREMQEIQNIIEVTRIHGLSLFFCSPSTRSHPSIHYNLEVLQRNVDKRISKVLVKKGDNVLGFILVKIPEDEKDNFWVDEYEPAKKEFVQQFLQRSTGRLDLDLCSKDLMKHKKWDLCKTTQLKQVICTKMFPTLTTQEINLIIANTNLI